MQIKDSMGKYSINFDVGKKVSYEKCVGLWTREDYLRYHNDYVTKIGPLLDGKPWVKLTDLTEYKTSDIADVMEKHAKWMLEKNAAFSALIVESSIAKMQLNMVVAGKFEQRAFLSQAEAAGWLATKGFK